MIEEEEKRLTPEEALRIWRKEAGVVEKTRGRLKVFLGYAPGVGKTYTMLNEANRLYARGRNVMIGYFESHGRADTIAQLKELPAAPLLTIAYNGIELHEMDVASILEAKPELVLVDELAHTNAPGLKHKKRYEDVLELLDHGIHVYTTVNLQHLESLNDIIETITGIHVNETVPDHLVREANEVVTIDLPPDSLRNRLRRGCIYKESKVPAALENFFREGNLTALREMTLRQTASQVDKDLITYRDEHKITTNWNTNERILVSISASPLSARLIRRGARLSQVMKCEFYVVYVHCTHFMSPQETEKSRKELQKNIDLARNLNAVIIELEGKSVSAKLLEFVEQKQITKLIIGHARRGLMERLFRGSTANKFIDHAKNVEVIVVPYEITKEPLS